MDLVIQIIAGAAGGYGAALLRRKGRIVSLFVGALGGTLSANVLVALLAPGGPRAASDDLAIGAAFVAALGGFILARVVGLVLPYAEPELRLGRRRRYPKQQD